MTYSTVEDLILGNVPTPSDAQKYVDLAAEEIDGMLGMRYVTPIVTDESSTGRPIRLLLKRVSTYLSSGRLILAKDAGGEDDQLHQYGFYLVNEATKVLNGILDGSIILPGIPSTNPDSIVATAPRIVNTDETSFVDDFVGVFGNPAANAINTCRPPAGYTTAWWRVHGG